MVSDVTDRYVEWFSDDTAKRYIAWALERQSVESLQSFVREREDKEDVVFLGIFTALGREHIGNIKFEPICSRTQTATMCILIGDPNWGKKIHQGQEDSITVFNPENLQSLL